MIKTSPIHPKIHHQPIVVPVAADTAADDAKEGPGVKAVEAVGVAHGTMVDFIHMVAIVEDHGLMPADGLASAPVASEC